MLNYMGPNIGSAPVSASLPPANPGTIPAGVPGSPPVNPILPVPKMPVSAPPGVVQNAGPSGPGAPPAPQDPSSIQYDTLTQQDGTVVVFMKNPDGSRGPAVKIINIKTPKAAGSQ